MKRVVAVIACLFLSGCGEGPKRISKPAYQHGKAAFELLDRYGRESEVSVEESGAFLLSAAGQEDLIPQAKGSAGLRRSLSDYEGVLSDRVTERLIVETDVINERVAARQNKSDDLLRSMAEKRYRDRQAESEIEPIVQMCRDDADQYFDENAAATNSCHASLIAFRKKYKLE